MTKQTIREELFWYNWIDNLEDKTVEEAIEWLTKCPQDAKLEVEYFGYDGGKSGAMITERLETDEEESTRESVEAARLAKIKKDLEDALYSAAIREEKYLASKNANEVALWAYLQKHNDSPRKGDLSNLYLTLLNLEAAGHGYDSIAAREIRECMSRLESE